MAHQSKAASDQTANRLNALNAGLRARLVEAEEIRTRFTKARDANIWPDLGSVSWIFTDRDSRSHQSS
jgi:hypothetical protein